MPKSPAGMKSSDSAGWVIDETEPDWRGPSALNVLNRTPMGFGPTSIRGTSRVYVLWAPSMTRAWVSVVFQTLSCRSNLRIDVEPLACERL